MASASAFAQSARLAQGVNELVTLYESDSPKLASVMKQHLTSADGDVLVDIHLQAGAAIADVLRELALEGFRLQSISALDASLIEGYLPLWSARSVVWADGLATIQAVQRPLKYAGSVQSQAVAFQKADQAHARGITGKGIRIGALSDSYDTCADCATHAGDDVTSGDLPADVVVIQDSPMGSDEGRAMLQLIHDVAPDSTLAFATADGGQVNFSNNILALRNTFKADVIVDDVVYLAEPMYSDGLLARTVDAVAKLGTAYFSSAGNNGLEAFEDVYAPASFAAVQARRRRTGEPAPRGIRRPATEEFHTFRNPDGSTSVTQKFTTMVDNVIRSSGTSRSRRRR